VVNLPTPDSLHVLPELDFVLPKRPLNHCVDFVEPDNPSPAPHHYAGKVSAETRPTTITIRNNLLSNAPYRHGLDCFPMLIRIHVALSTCRHADHSLMHVVNFFLFIVIKYTIFHLNRLFF
jgi:hypothetical protein